TYDPTPPAVDSGLGRGGGDIVDKLRRMLDTLRLSWFKWVIEYDLMRQLGLLHDVADALGLGPGGRFNTKVVSAWIKANRGVRTRLRGGAALAIGAFLLWRRRRRLRRAGASGRRGPDHAVVGLYVRAARTLARRGFPRPPGQTPREHARALV